MKKKRREMGEAKQSYSDREGENEREKERERRERERDEMRRVKEKKCLFFRIRPFRDTNDQISKTFHGRKLQS